MRKGTLGGLADELRLDFYRRLGTSEYSAHAELLW